MLGNTAAGLGLTTVTAAVDAVAISDARIFTVSRELLTKVVARGPPLQFTPRRGRIRPVHRQSEGWAAGRGGIGNERLVNEGHRVLGGGRRGQRG